MSTELHTDAPSEMVAPRMVSFTVIGTAAPQGSKVKTKWGVREDNPRTKPWRATVAADAAEAMAGRPLIHMPVEVRVRFYFPRPKTHYRTGAHAHELKPGAPLLHTSLPDIDKLCRAIGDSLSGTVLRDDRLIAHWDPWKFYGEPARAEIVVTSDIVLPDDVVFSSL